MTPHLSGFDVAAILAKALVYASTLGASGSVFFLGYSDTGLQGLQRTHLIRQIRWLSVLAIVATALRISLLSGSMSDEFSGLFDRTFVSMILAAGEGRASAVRLAGLALILIALSTGKRRAPAVSGAALAASSFAWVGHTQALHALYPAALLTLHLLCAAFWLGALYPLLYLARSGDAAQLSQLAERFGRIALVLVPALIVAGAALLIALLPSLDAIWQSSYGRSVLIKMSLVALLLAAAGFNRLTLTPRLLRNEASAVRMLRYSIRAEMLLGFCILLVTALFTSATGPEG